ncbi:hypothetical protein ACFO0N_15135 [Halobium salinum]|uniref:DUF8128 domain-containing protein n=1 Tax=Halobium salinum TaxID=1364940 RepID=A0ABD5PEZ3_9EURY|nr:hypothetical protein [Halobium salinum]
MKIRKSQITASEEQAQQLQHSNKGWYSIQVRPPRETPPARLDSVIRGATEASTKWFGLRNASPVIAYEIRRHRPGQLQFQFSTPSVRLDRKLRNHLTDAASTTEIQESSTNGLPVFEDETIGVGQAELLRRDWNPLETDFDSPPVNKLVGSLHQNAMQDTKFVVQLLFQPVAGHPVRRRWSRREAFNRGRKLRNKKQLLVGERTATPLEKKRAKLLEEKAAGPLYNVRLRVVAIGAGEYTGSRIRELAGCFNQYNHSESRQKLGVKRFKSVRSVSIFRLLKAVRDRQLSDLDAGFRASVEEVGALASLPDRSQSNIVEARP